MDKKRLILKVVINCTLVVVLTFLIVFIVKDIKQISISNKNISFYKARALQLDDGEVDAFGELVISEHTEIRNERILRIAIEFPISIILTCNIALLWLNKRLPIKTPAQLDEERQARMKRQRERKETSTAAKREKLEQQLKDLEKDGK